MAKAPTAKRYAEAMFKLAQEHGSEGAWLEQLERAREALAEPTVRTYFGLPQVQLQLKLDAAAQLLEGADPLVVNMVGLLTSRRALSLLPAVVSEYAALLNDSRGLVQATVTSAVPLTDAQQGRLRGQLRDMLDKDVALDVQQDPEVIGGVVVRVGDQVIDGSVRTRLQALRQRLAQAPAG